MKKLIAILFCCICLYATGQTTKDSLTYEQKLAQLETKFIEQENNLNQISGNLFKCHKEFKTGFLLTIAGATITSIGALSQYKVYTSHRRYTSGTKSFCKGMLIVGGCLSTVGCIIVLDSHKWINPKYKKPSSY